MRERVVGLGQRADAVQEAGARDAQGHRLGIVAVEAGHRMVDQLAGLGVRHRADLFKTLQDRLQAVGLIAGDAGLDARLAVGGQDGCMTMQAGAGLLETASPAR